MKEFYVRIPALYSFETIVKAENEEEAIKIGQEKAMQSEDGDWQFIDYLSDNNTAEDITD